MKNNKYTLFSSTKSIFIIFVNLIFVLFLDFWLVYSSFNLLPSESLEASLSQIIEENKAFSWLQIDESIHLLELSLNEHRLDLDKMQDKYKNILEHQEVAIQEYSYVWSEILAVQEDISSRIIQLRIYQQKIKTLSNIQNEVSKDLYILKRYVQAYSRIALKYIWRWTLDDWVLWSLVSLTWELDIWQQQLIKMLLDHLIEALKDVASQQQLYIEKLQSLYLVAAQFQDLNAEQYNRLNTLQNQIRTLDELLTNLQDDRSTIEDFVEEITTSEKLLQASILELETDVKEQVNFLDLISQKINSSWFLERSRRLHYLSRPIDDVWEILYNVPRTTEYHGLTLAVDQWKEVYAPAGSYVVDMYKSEDRSLSWVLLSHSDWSSTLMYPFSEVYLEKDQIVPRWHIIWLTGGATATRGSGRGSVSSHLNFHVFEKWDVIDPLMVLDISVWWDIEQLPPAYHSTYLSLSEKRNVYVHDVTLVPGDTLSQRVSRYLSRNAWASFSDPQLWYNAAQWTWVDPLMGICIAAAETSWRNFSTANNIWNVWNNDRGDRVAYISPARAVRAIYSTLSNKYLWSYTQLSQFSRFWNNSWYIYASDPKNWQRNVQRCLVWLKHIYIDEEYFVRKVN